MEHWGAMNSQNRPSSDDRTVRVALLGCGVVGSQVARLIHEQADDLAARQPQRHIAHDRPAAIALAEPGDGQPGAPAAGNEPQARAIARSR